MFWEVLIGTALLFHAQLYRFYFYFFLEGGRSHYCCDYCFNFRPDQEWQREKTPETSTVSPANSSAGRAGRAHGRLDSALRNRGPFILSSVFNAAISPVQRSSFFLPFILFYFWGGQEKEAVFSSQLSAGRFF